jgi:hypothetical protein
MKWATSMARVFFTIKAIIKLPKWHFIIQQQRLECAAGWIKGMTMSDVLLRKPPAQVVKSEDAVPGWKQGDIRQRGMVYTRAPRPSSGIVWSRLFN